MAAKRYVNYMSAAMNHARAEKAQRVNVVCMECGKKWATSNLIPECPKCGGVDVEPRD